MSTSSIKEVASILNSHIFGKVVAIDDLLYINMRHCGGRSVVHLQMENTWIYY